MNNNISRISLSFVIGILFLMLIVPSIANAAFTQLQLTSTTTPSTITPGGNGYIELRISNVGTLASNRIKLTSVRAEPPVSISSAPIDIGYIGIGDTISTRVKFNVSATANQGFYFVYFTVDDCDDTTCKSYSHTAVVMLQSAPNIDVSISPAEMKPGEQSTINFIIENMGGAISDFDMTFQTSAFTPVGRNNRIFVQNMNAGQTLTVPVQVFVDPKLSSGVYTVKMDAIYRDQTANTRNLSLQIGFVVKENVKLITTLESQSVLNPNSDGNVTIKISNSGQDIRFLLMNVSDDNIRVKPSEIYIGNLKSDDYDTEKLNLHLGNVTEGMHALHLTLTYVDVFGQHHTENHEVYIIVTRKIQDFSGLAIMIGVVMVIVLFVIWLIRKKK